MTETQEQQTSVSIESQAKGYEALCAWLKRELAHAQTTDNVAKTCYEHKYSLTALESLFHVIQKHIVELPK